MKKKKSLVGWTWEKWDLEWGASEPYGKCRCDWQAPRLTKDKSYPKDKKVQITLEEL